MCLKYPHCKRNGVISHLQKQAKGLDMLDPVLGVRLLHIARHSTGKKVVFLDWKDHRCTSPLYSGSIEAP